MSHPTDIKPQAIQFYSTASYACSYLENEQARSMVAAPSHLVDAKTYSQLVDQGFRRSGTFTYKPYCDDCQACIPIRIDVANFSADRSQRRILRRLAGMQGRILPLQWNDEHYVLYRRYQQKRHPGSGMDEDTASQYSQFLLSSHVDSRLIEFRDENHKLQIVAIIDLLDNGVSAVYTFFNPESKASLGTYAILWQIQMCHNLGLPWLYLGYWIEESRKMAYKTRFIPYQLLERGKWSAPSL
ncbi:arginyltransferase [Paenalcaligenes niemegkensis]|uniref:arginyltransferase n=1 Tax=Paenalcaligenes niemegkensis TaxID=2895469 RepID=UPI001EE7C093|nr:arginyltransferase [Paenalcaligenes niemegkensis]MCQ9617097.1 arginyltransferase [Paenalcaligenes niemegkensis]